MNVMKTIHSAKLFLSSRDLYLMFPSQKAPLASIKYISAILHVTVLVNKQSVGKYILDCDYIKIKREFDLNLYICLGFWPDLQGELLYAERGSVTPSPILF